MGSWLLAPEVSVFNSPSRQGHLLLQVTSMLSTNATTRLLFFKWNLACEQADLHRLFAEKWLCLASCLPDPQKVSILANETESPDNDVIRPFSFSFNKHIEVIFSDCVVFRNNFASNTGSLQRCPGNHSKWLRVSSFVMRTSKVFSLWHYPHHTCYEVWTRL